MELRRLVLAATVLAATWSGPCTESASASEDIGQVKRVLFYAYGTPVGHSRQGLFARDSVYTNEVVETVKKAALHIRFQDGFDFRLGAASRATLDRFIYDPGSETGELTLSLRAGIFRLKTGRMKKEGILVVTPVALIGVAGTDFIIQILADGTLVAAVLEGRITITPLVAGAASLSLVARETAHVETSGRVTLAVGWPRADPGLEDWLMPQRNRRSDGAQGGKGGGR